MGPMAIDLYAGIPVTDFAAALEWYSRLFGCPPDLLAGESEAVWDLAEHRSVYIRVQPNHAGHAMHNIFVDDLDAVIDELEKQGLQPAKLETYPNGVRKATYYDPDGNETGFGGGPLDT